MNSVDHANPIGYSVTLAEILHDPELRLDAEHYDPNVESNMEILQRSGFELVPLSKLAALKLPSQFTRVWARDSAHGFPYLNATDLMSWAAFGVPALERYLSKASDVDFDNLVIREKWILMTCSGTIGRVFEVPPALDGWIATHDIIRIVPNDDGLRGYIKAFLCSRFAQTQILKHTHGGQIDHITDVQLGTCLVPLFEDSEMRRISAVVDRAESLRQEASVRFADAIIDITKGLTRDG
ncbi:MAG: hypothetical protein IPM16_23030 [Chloroflexi bacterium]|nr:hypothetical protein [Chloroflexota bacterium]